jgi:DNA-3-methyladenine glycosylase I
MKTLAARNLAQRRATWRDAAQRNRQMCGTNPIHGDRSQLSAGPEVVARGRAESCAARATVVAASFDETNPTPVMLPHMPDNHRCAWATTELGVAYHDREWGVPQHDDRVLFEFLILEGAQAGLSWETILRKRENYRKAFANFDPKKVAKFDARKVASLLKDPGIVRNKLKVAGAVKNAKAFLKVQEEFGSFDAYVWRFVDGRPIVNKRDKLKNVPSRTAESDAMSKDLVRRGFTFVGSTICYAFMQAVGMVNDHEAGCFRHREVGR